MKTIIKTTVLALFISLTVSAQNEKDILGKWKTDDNANVEAEIYLSKDGLYYGKVIKDNGKNVTNGKIILKKLVYNSKKKSFKGKLSPHDRDMEFNATLTFEGEDKLKVEASKFLVFSKTIYFLKIK
jgi:uncharacterized protein (DUF2147 family)